jgi:Tfp pilus assembly protein PilV
VSARGFSLLEVLVAGVMFVVVVAGVVATWSTVTGLQGMQQRRTAAIILAEDVLDDLRLRFRGADDLAIGVHERCFTVDRVPAACPQSAGFTVRWDVLAVAQRTFLQIDLVVRWTGANGVEHAVPFSTFRAN